MKTGHKVASYIGACRVPIAGQCVTLSNRGKSNLGAENVSKKCLKTSEKRCSGSGRCQSSATKDKQSSAAQIFLSFFPRLCHHHRRQSRSRTGWF